MQTNKNARPASSKKPSISHIKHIDSNIKPNEKMNKTTLPRNCNKSVECTKKKYVSPSKKKAIIPTVEKKEFDLSQAMRVSRQKDLAQITKNVALLKYYNCLIMLFMTVFTSSQLIITNIFTKQHKTYPSFGFALIDGLLKVYQTTKMIQKEVKLHKLARNIMKIAQSPSQFERKVQFISRKTVLNYQKRRQIELSFINHEVESFWKKFSRLFFINNQIEFMQDVFEYPSEKLCLKDFQYLIDSYLATDRFEQDDTTQLLLTNTNNEPMNQQTHFTVEFTLIQKICLIEHTSPSPASLQKPKPKTSRCDIY